MHPLPLLFLVYTENVITKVSYIRICFAKQNPTEEKDKKDKASSPSPLQESNTNGGPHAHSLMLPNGLASEDDAKGFKYATEAASNGLPYHMTVDSYGRSSGSRQPSPSEEDLTKNHSPGVPLKSGDGMGMQQSNAHTVGSLTGPIQVPGVGLTNGMGAMSGLVNGGPSGPPGKVTSTNATNFFYKTKQRSLYYNKYY